MRVEGRPRRQRCAQTGCLEIPNFLHRKIIVYRRQNTQLSNNYTYIYFIFIIPYFSMMQYNMSLQGNADLSYAINLCCMLWQALPSGLCLHVHRLVSTSRSYTHTHTRLFTPCFTCTAYTQEPNHNGGTQEDKGTTAPT